MIFFQQFFLDRERDIIVDLYLEGERMFYVIRTPNHHTGNLISNLAKLCSLETSEDDNGLRIIRGEIPRYVDGLNRDMFILRLGNTKVANIFPDGRVELKASIPAISKTLMSQTKEYRPGIEKTIVKTYIRADCKFRSDLHTHMNGNLPPDILIALAIVRQIRYPYYYIKKLGLRCAPSQLEQLEADRVAAEMELGDTGLTGRKRERRIDDHTFINFANLILGNLPDAAYNMNMIRCSLTVPKDGQAVFADLEKVYLYRYVFTRGIESSKPFSGVNAEWIPDRQVRAFAEQMLRDREDDRYRRNTLFQDLLLWIAREYRRHGICYAEISDTSILSRASCADRLRQIHGVMPAVTRETGVVLRFLAGIRRTPLTIVRDKVPPEDYLAENLRCLRAIAGDPYVAGSDIIGEEINDIRELRGVFRELVSIAGGHPGFVIRIHAGENDSLPNNVANSIRCVRDSLAEGQAMPHIRIGHGLYTCDLRSARGRKLLDDLRDGNVVLEFQITSNVRLNNLSRLDRHPLRQYLSAGISCVQGTDGGALYGTNSIDEELSLEKLLDLSHDELLSMRAAEDRILKESMDDFNKKQELFRSICPGDPESFYRAALEAVESKPGRLLPASGKVSSSEALASHIVSLPEGLFPVILAGGSFNSSLRRTQPRPEDMEFIDTFLENADPSKTAFFVGHTLAAHEGYLVRKAAGRFRIIAIVPSMLTPAEASRLADSGVGIIVSIESSPMGIYKSFAYEIFRLVPSALLVFDGNSAALNLIQEARNARKKCGIYINPRSRGLAGKARLLEGYVTPLGDPVSLVNSLNIAVPPVLQSQS